MASPAKGSVPVPLEPLGAGFRGDVAPHLAPLGTSPFSRNVLSHNNQVFASSGWAKLRLSGNSNFGNKRILNIAQYFASPFVDGDPVVFFTKPEVRFYEPGSDTFVDITAPRWAASNDVPPTWAIDVNGHMLVATGNDVFIWAPRVDGSVTSPRRMRQLGGLADERVLIEQAFVVSFFEPHALLGRIKQDGAWYPNRYAWSDLNDPERWFIGFDEELGITSLAGFADLPPNKAHETPTILSIESCRDLLAIWTNWDCYTLQYVGAPNMWVRRLVQHEFGARNYRCVVNFGDHHMVAGSDGDFYDTNLVDKQSVGSPVRDWINNRITGIIYGYRRFVPYDSVVWAFSTDPDNPSVPDTAAVFDVKEGHWDIIDHPFWSGAAVDRSGVSGSIRGAGTINDLDLAAATIDDLDDVADTINELSLDELSRSVGRANLDAEVLGANDGNIYKRSGWTKNGADLIAEWRTPVLDFGDPIVRKWVSGYEVALVKEANAYLSEIIPPDSYQVLVSSYGSQNRDVDWEALSPAQTRSYTLGGVQDQRLKFRSNFRFHQVGIRAVSTNASPKPWSLRRLYAFVVPAGQR